MRPLLALLLLWCAPAHAHFTLLQPPSAVARDNGGKGGPPCSEGPPSNIVTPIQGGRALTIRLNEFIFHPGHYRIALSVNSRSELPPDPEVVSDANGISISSPLPGSVKAPVLADGVFPHTSPINGDLQTTVTLPNLNCDKCTLQIIEFMAEHSPAYFYHHCADLKITADPTLPPAGAEWPRAVTAVFPYLAGPATVTLINPGAVTVNATLPAGDRVTIAPNATAMIPVTDPSGWLEVKSDGPLGGYALVKDAAVPLLTTATPILPFDNTDGASTTLYTVNPSTAPATVTAVFYDDGGTRLATQTLAIDPRRRAEISAPELAGKRGIVRVDGGLPTVAVRTAASGALTVLPAVQ